MTDATPTHAPTSPILATLRFAGKTIRATRHPAHGRLMMAHDVLLAIGQLGIGRASVYRALGMTPAQAAQTALPAG